MGFFDYWLGRSLGYVDELSIARGVSIGMQTKDSKHQKVIEDMYYFTQNKSTILAENEYQKDLKRASAEISKRFGWLKFSPLQFPERLTKEQRNGVPEIINYLSREGIIKNTSAERMLKTLEE